MKLTTQRTETDHIGQRKFTIGENISVWLKSCLNFLDLTKQVKLLLIQHKQSS